MSLTRSASEDKIFAPAIPMQANTTLLVVGGNIAGIVSGDTFYKSIDVDKQILRTPPTIVLDLASLYQARQVGATYVEVFDSKTGDVYRAPLDTILRDGRTVGRQVALPLKLWQRLDPEVQR